MRSKIPGSNERKLKELFQNFVFELYTGTYLLQLTAVKQQQHIHVQLMDDLGSLQLHQATGRIVEFPL